MKNFEELNYYEILDISVDASSFEISRAYKNALEFYSENSLLTYSLFSDRERENILEKIESAYNTLSDRTKREAYDSSLGNKPPGVDRQHKPPQALHSKPNEEDFLLNRNEGSLTADGEYEANPRSQNLFVEVRAGTSLSNTNGLYHGGSAEQGDLSRARNFRSRVFYRILLGTLLFVLTLLIFLEVPGPKNLLSKYYQLISRREHHGEKKSIQADVEVPDLRNRKASIEEESENAANEAATRAEGISSAKSLPEVYENIANLANIRTKPTLDSQIISKIAGGKEVNVVGKNGDWFMVELQNGTTGWIHESLIRERHTSIQGLEASK